MFKKVYQISSRALCQAGRLFVLTVVLLPGLAVAQLAGTYTIGSGGDFATFKNAVDTLRSQGVDSAVIFNVLAGTYREQIVIPEIGGADSSNIITFQSLAGVADSVVLWDSTTADTNYIVKLDSADYIIFKDMTFESYGTTHTGIFHLENDARHNRITDNILNSHFSGSPTTNQAAIYSPGGLTYCTHDILIEGNVFNGTGLGIYLQGRGWSVYYDDSTRIISNTFNIVGVGIRLDNHHAPLIEGNEIHETSITGDGILLINCRGALRVLRNKVYFRSYSGIDISGCQGTSSERGLIANNFVRNTGSSPEYLRGIAIRFDSPYHDVFHNTVIFESVTSYGVFLASNGGHAASNVRVFNNNFVCLDRAFAYFHNTFPYSMVTVSDYNNIYNASNSLAYWGTGCPKPGLLAQCQWARFELDIRLPNVS